MTQSNQVTHAETKYYGIWVQREVEHFWICDANGNDEYIGTQAPSAEQIDCYRNSIVK